MIGKVQSNTCLLVPFTGTQKKGRGRPRKYVGRFDQNDTNQYAEKAVLPGNISLFSAIVYSRTLGQNIKIVSAYHLSTDKKIGTFFSTDLQLSIVSLQIAELWHFILMQA